MSGNSVEKKELVDVNNQIAVREFIAKEAMKLKPETLFVPELMWKYLIRSAIRGKNIMMTGYSGCGKTLSALSLSKSLDRPFFYFNLGSTQDPRAALIGNTHFDKDKGTFFSKSEFIDAISTENAVILLDEFSRANPEAENILMTVLDYNQRYVRLDESESRDIIHVAKGVTFIATANIGGEFTATRLMDRASLDRFIIVEVPLLDAKQEKKLLLKLYPELHVKIAEAIAEVAEITRNEMRNDAPKINTIISTRMSVETAGLILDGFSFYEALEVGVLAVFDEEGGIESARAFVKKAMQRFDNMKNDMPEVIEPEESEEPEEELTDDDELFDLDDDSA
jgi:MoxR-like ATPase